MSTPVKTTMDAATAAMAATRLTRSRRPILMTLDLGH
jgi:hypothetical protein